MRGNVSIKLTGYHSLIRKLNRLGENVQREIGWEFQVAANEIRNDAIKAAPADQSGIRNAISVKEAFGKVNREFEVVVGKNYAPFVEFGTKGKFNAPSELGSWPAQFKRKVGGGSFKDGWRAMIGWVHRHRQYYPDVKTSADERRAAYFTLLKKIREGIEAQPYLFPAFFKGRQRLVSRLKNILKQETRR